MQDCGQTCRYCNHFQITEQFMHVYDKCLLLNNDILNANMTLFEMSLL